MADGGLHGGEEVAARLHALRQYGDEPDWAQAIAYSEEEGLLNRDAWAEQVAWTREMARIVLDVARDVAGGAEPPDPEALAARLHAVENSARGDVDWETALRMLAGDPFFRPSTLADQVAATRRQVAHAFELMGRPLPTVESLSRELEAVRRERDEALAVIAIAHGAPWANSPHLPVSLTEPRTVVMAAVVAARTANKDQDGIDFVLQHLLRAVRTVDGLVARVGTADALTALVTTESTLSRSGAVVTLDCADPEVAARLYDLLAGRSGPDPEAPEVPVAPSRAP